MKFENIDIKEQETIINIDYYEKKVTLYTSRKTVYNLLVAKLGEPTQTYYINKKVSGASWNISFKDKKNLSAAFSRTVLMRGL